MDARLLRAVTVSLVLMCIPFAADADVLYLKNGHAIEGRVKRVRDGYVEFEALGGVLKFREDQIDRKVLTPKQDSKPKASAGEEQQPTAAVGSGIDENGRQITVKAQLNGKLWVNLAVDTEAPTVVLRERVVRSLGINPKNIRSGRTSSADGAQVQGHFFTLNKVEVQHAVAEGLEASVMVNEGELLREDIDGYLGTSFLEHFEFTIDPELKTIVFK